jgi:hypothetical protein
MISLHIFWTDEDTHKLFGPFRYYTHTEDGIERGAGFVFGPFGVSIGKEYINGH